MLLVLLYVHSHLFFISHHLSSLPGAGAGIGAELELAGAGVGVRCHDLAMIRAGLACHGHSSRTASSPVSYHYHAPSHPLLPLFPTSTLVHVYTEWSLTLLPLVLPGLLHPPRLRRLVQIPLERIRHSHPLHRLASLYLFHARYAHNQQRRKGSSIRRLVFLFR